MDHGSWIMDDLQFIKVLFYMKMQIVVH